MNISKLSFAAALATTLAIPVAAQERVEEMMPTIKPASEVGGQRLGTLNCTIAGGWGLFLGSSKDVSCTFKHEGGMVENYTGTMDKLGLDIGKTDTSYMTWVVFTAAENKPGDFTLAGTYVGLSADVSLGIGLGANALVGGSEKQFGLQPISVQSVTGVNLALALASLTLVPAG